MVRNSSNRSASAIRSKSARAFAKLPPAKRSAPTAFSTRHFLFRQAPHQVGGHGPAVAQDGALVHTNHGMPVIMGRGVTVGHGAIIHGCRIGDNCLIGMGAILLDGVVVEDNCIIGAGSVVAEHTVVPAGSLVLGVPGRVKRSLTEEEIKKIAINADEYKELARTYRNAK
jgi:carbonic anhydrase/acetyltransferase-like protein (isoleucine patch superfamily)